MIVGLGGPRGTSQVSFHGDLLEQVLTTIPELRNSDEGHWSYLYLRKKKSMRRPWWSSQTSTCLVSRLRSIFQRFLTVARL